MKKILLLFVFIFSVSFNIFAQTGKLYMPLDVKSSYDNGFRSYDGNSGKNYWVNSSNYKIQINFDPQLRIVEGKEQITYFNNSPDSLTQIVLRLYQDIYKKGNSRDWPINPDAVSNGTIISKIIVDGVNRTKELNTPEISNSATNITIKLNKKLPPLFSINLEFEWNFEIPKVNPIRMGLYDSTSFMIAYFYPQIAVYDDIDGWDIFDYSGIQEFYNDICNFEVEITVPKNFIVWATGVLQNPDELLNNPYLERLKIAHESTQIIKIIKPEDLAQKNFTKDKDFLTWKFNANNVPDFAFSLSDHFLWDGTTIVTDKRNNKKTFISAAYQKEGEDFTKVAEISKKSIEFFSNKIPGVPFPYPSLTVFNGGGGMEYPMMVNEGIEKDNWNGTVHVTSHEILHTYFPFYMGINERKYAWMDEGMAVMLPYQIQKEIAQGYEPEARNIINFEKSSGKEFEVPLMILTTNLKSKPYRMQAYIHSAAAYSVLQDIIGEDNFKKCLVEYINRWNGKHPIPYDFFNTFENVLDEDLTWFWKPWFFEQGYPDLRIENVQITGQEAIIKIAKIGNMPIPIMLTLKSLTGYEMKVYRSANVWKDNKNFIEIKVNIEQPINSVIIGNKNIPDVDKGNNEFTIK
ncbi:MAG: M1 family metallopeptidase [bacterium]